MPYCLSKIKDTLYLLPVLREHLILMRVRDQSSEKVDLDPKPDPNPSQIYFF